MAYWIVYPDIDDTCLSQAQVEGTLKMWLTENVSGHGN